MNSVVGARDRRFPLLLWCFFLSGFAALLYETAWTREFAFVFGTSELAVVAVLAAYMGGLAAGAGVGGKLAHRVRRPILAYGLLELSIAGFALAVPWAIRAATVVYTRSFGGLIEPPAHGSFLGACFYLLAAFAILLPCTGLMGATLPLLVRHAVRRDEQVGSRIGILYATNTAGAIAGALGAAFVLLPLLGLRHTVYVGAAVNALVFAAAALLSRHGPLPASQDPAAEPARPIGSTRSRWILPVVALSGVTSFSYEVLWTRLLGQLLGGSIYAFATMLASFLLGIALGSAVASRVATTRRRGGWGFVAAEFGIGLFTLAGFAVANGPLPALSQWLGAGVQGGLAANVILCTAVMLPSALCVGATFPFAVRMLARDAGDAPACSARVYAWSTGGAIVGAIAAGFALLPLLGFAGTVLAGAALNAGLAVAAAGVSGLGARPLLALAAAGLAALLLLRPQQPWTLLRTTLWETTGWSPRRSADHDGVAYFGVGRSATVLLLEARGEWELRAGGLVEALIERRGARAGRYLAERWLGALPLLARPDARSLLVVGLGGGTVVESVPPAFESITVVELEAEIVAALRAVGGERSRDPLADERVRVVVNDVRGALALSTARYEAIVSQPSHPWTAGASHLYTREFFELVRDHLTPSGVFVQWMGLSYVDEPLAQILVATLLDAFPFVEVLQKRGELLFVASAVPLDIDANADRAIAAAPEHFARLGIFHAEDVSMERVLDAAAARRFADGAAVNTDDTNRIATRSPRVLAAPLGATGADRLFASWLPRDRQPDGLDLYRVRRLFVNGGPARAQAIADSTPDPVDRLVGLANAAFYEGRSEGLALLQQALRSDPAHHEARTALLRIWGDSIQRGGSLPEALRATPGTAAERAVLAGWSGEAAGDWAAVRALDEELARVDPRDPLYPPAVRLRVAWRRESGDPVLAREALRLLDPLLAGQHFIKDVLLRVDLAVAAGDRDAALSSLSEIATFLTPAQRGFAAAARERLASLPDDASDRLWRDAIDTRLTSLAEGA